MRRAKRDGEEAAIAGKAKPRLEVTLEPATSIFRDEGGKFNYLCAFFVLRSGQDGLPAEVEAAMASDGTIPLKCELLYEDGALVPVRQGKPALQIFGSAGTQKPEEAGASCNCRDRHGSVRYRILKLSRNHDGKQFRLRISLDGVATDVIAPALTRPTLVLSKRKWLRANERAPEGNQRKRLEELAARQNIQLSREATSTRATGDELHVPVRELAGLPTLEAKYPRPVNIHMYTSNRDHVHGGHLSQPSIHGNRRSYCHETESACVSRRSSVIDSEDEDPEYVPRPTTSSGRRVLSTRARQASVASMTSGASAPASMLPAPYAPLAPPSAVASGTVVAGAASPAAAEPAKDPQTTAILRKVLDQLQVLQGEIKRYNNTVLESSRRIDALEAENRSLKRQLSDVVVASGDLHDDASRMYKRSKPNPAPLSLAPLTLPRSHSLGMVGDSLNLIGADDDGMAPVLSDIESVFGGPGSLLL